MVGFVLGSWGEVNLSWTGVTFGMVSSIFVALYSIYVKKAIVLLDGDQWYCRRILSDLDLASFHFVSFRFVPSHTLLPH